MEQDVKATAVIFSTISRFFPTTPCKMETNLKRFTKCFKRNILPLLLLRVSEAT